MIKCSKKGSRDLSRRILITGAGGFIGSNATSFFVNQGDKVVALDNLSRLEILDQDGTFQSNWRRLEDLDNVECVEGDILDQHQVKELVADADAVIHAAGQTAVTKSMNDPVTDFQLNARGTLNLLEAARKSSTDPSIVYCSTNKVYGDNVNNIPVREEETRYVFDDETFEEGIPESFSIDHTGHSPYGCSKLAGDIYMQDYAESYGVQTGVFRMSCIYGPRQLGVEDQGWLAWFTLATLMDETITIYGDGKQVRDVLYVDDLIECYDAFLKSSHDSGVWNVGGGIDKSISLLELLDILETVTGKSPNLEYGDWRPHDQKVFLSDIGKARSELNWNPDISVERGIEQMTQWIEDHLSTLQELV